MAGTCLMMTNLNLIKMILLRDKAFFYKGLNLKLYITRCLMIKEQSIDCSFFMSILGGGGSMADNFGLKIGVEGEREFKKSLREINQKASSVRLRNEISDIRIR